ncbi:MAG: Tim44 domain-containing protein, partial [Rhodopila sp.]
MRRTSALIAGSAALALALSPGLAEARAGDGGSFGSRGSMTYSAPPTTRTAPSSAQPMQRSMTPNAPQPGYNNNGGFAPGYQQSRGSSFTSGLLGGLIGAGIGGLL